MCFGQFEKRQLGKLKGKNRFTRRQSSFVTNSVRDFVVCIFTVIIVNTFEWKYDVHGALGNVSLSISEDMTACYNVYLVFCVVLVPTCK